MSESQGVPEIPPSLLAEADVSDDNLLQQPSSASETSRFIHIWRSVLQQERDEGLQPFSGPYTVLLVAESGMRLAVPCDLPCPFRADPQFQRQFLRRHVLTETLTPTDERFAAGGQAARLDGGNFTLAMEEGKPAFAVEGRPPMVATHVPGEHGAATVYTIGFPLMSHEEIMEGVRRLKPRPWFSTRPPRMEPPLPPTDHDLAQ